MARCYEFGVAIASGCEHPMRVVAEGGRCECETCGALCSGRFGGCASIISMPGYVPVSAPTTFPAEPALEPEAQPEPDGAWHEVQAELAELRAILDEALETMTSRAPTPASHAQLIRLRLRLAAARRAHHAAPPE